MPSSGEFQVDGGIDAVAMAVAAPGQCEAAGGTPVVEILPADRDVILAAALRRAGDVTPDEDGCIRHGGKAFAGIGDDAVLAGTGRADDIDQAAGVHAPKLWRAMSLNGARRSG